MKDFSNGNIYLAYFTYGNNEGGKNRPVAFFEDPETKEIYVCQISSSVTKPIVDKIGYVIKDWEAAGLDKPSYISCERNNVRLLNPNTLIKPIGKLSQRDISGLLIKRIKVLENEHQQMLEKMENIHKEEHEKSTHKIQIELER